MPHEYGAPDVGCQQGHPHQDLQAPFDPAGSPEPSSARTAELGLAAFRHFPAVSVVKASDLAKNIHWNAWHIFRGAASACISRRVN
jgi:hypothetical protein